MKVKVRKEGRNQIQGERIFNQEFQEDEGRQLQIQTERRKKGMMTFHFLPSLQYP